MTIYDVAIAFCGRFGGARRAVGLVWVWWFVGARLVGFLLALLLPLTSKPITTNDDAVVDVNFSKLPPALLALIFQRWMVV